MTQLIFGMLFWMPPQVLQGTAARPRESRRGAAYWRINGGLVLRVVGEPLTALQPDWAAGWLLGLSRCTSSWAAAGRSSSMRGRA